MCDVWPRTKDPVGIFRHCVEVWTNSSHWPDFDNETIFVGFQIVGGMMIFMSMSRGIWHHCFAACLRSRLAGRYESNIHSTQERPPRTRRNARMLVWIWSHFELPNSGSFAEDGLTCVPRMVSGISSNTRASVQVLPVCIDLVTVRNSGSLPLEKYNPAPPGCIEPPFAANISLHASDEVP
ncbi:hypothetical protein F4780DRAFT_535843 [Xylariomycetidae sp. FL0641]|nr:hypothetical protein F4780DRAFT_535843 [Xylariomycetidae sp. FL0641]